MNKLQRTHYENRQDWLAGRGIGIGASEAAAIVGMSPWMSATQLWRQKLGLDKPKEVNNEAVERGVRLEPALRGLYAAENPQYTVDYHAFDILAQEDRPWLFATLDGELTDENGRRGILEIKTASCIKRTDWDKWNGRIPPNYYAQIMHQLLATGFDFVDLYGCLFNQDNDKTIRTYHFERDECEDDLKWILEHETEFWYNIQHRIMPSALLSL